MKCNEFAELLSAYADGELTEREAARIRAHIAECSLCAERLAALETLHSKLTEMNSEPLAHNDMTAKVMTSLPVRRKQPSVRLLWSLAAVGLIVAFCAVWPMIHRKSEPAKPTTAIAQRRETVPNAAEKHDSATLTPTLSPQGRGSHPTARPHRHHKIRPDRLDRPAETPIAASRPEKLGPIQVAATSRTVDGRVETTVVIKAGGVALSRVKSTEISIAPDSSAAATERPPLEVVRNGDTALLKPSGG